LPGIAAIADLATKLCCRRYNADYEPVLLPRRWVAFWYRVPQARRVRAAHPSTGRLAHSRRRRTVQRQILALDMAGTPRKWVSAESAVIYYAKALVAWEFGDIETVFHGGWQASGARSIVRVANIIAVRGAALHGDGFGCASLLTNDKLFARDHRLCAYCGERFRERDLSREHVIPLSRGGRDAWMNVVTACRDCNTRKGGRTPDQARMPLLYLPYVPSRWEDFILVNRHILADQMDYLLAKVPTGSRLRN
jgi:HNH endonuclease